MKIFTPFKYAFSSSRLLANPVKATTIVGVGGRAVSLEKPRSICKSGQNVIMYAWGFPQERLVARLRKCGVPPIEDAVAADVEREITKDR
jgi:hypothetical protein